MRFNVGGKPLVKKSFAVGRLVGEFSIARTGCWFDSSQPQKLQIMWVRFTSDYSLEHDQTIFTSIVGPFRIMLGVVGWNPGRRWSMQLKKEREATQPTDKEAK